MRKPHDHSSLSTQPPALPDPGEGKRGIDGHLPYLLRQAAAAVRLRMERALADIDVTPPQFMVMTMIAAYPGLSNADIARLAVLTPQTVSVIIANLERASILCRKPHAVHGRIQHLALTEAGLARLSECKDRVKDVEGRIAAGLTPDEDHIVRKWLVSLSATP